MQSSLFISLEHAHQPPSAMAQNNTITAAASRAGTPVVVEFGEPLTLQQQLWLRTTRAFIRRVAFHVNDSAPCTLLSNPHPELNPACGACRAVVTVHRISVHRRAIASRAQSAGRSSQSVRGWCGCVLRQSADHLCGSAPSLSPG